MAVTLADGTEVTLEIPDGALAFETEIGIAGVAAVDGWDFAPEGLAAVQLAPSGLELFVPALLTFRRPSNEAIGSTGEIAWAGEGTDLHPVLGLPQSHGSAIPIEHFSGYGFVWNLDMGYWGDWERYRARTWQAYLEQNLAVVLRVDMQRQVMGVETEFDLTKAVLSQLDQWYDWVYRSLMTAAGTSCENARAAAIAQLTFARMLALIDLDIHDTWERFAEKRRSEGKEVPYTFDGLSFDFVTRLIETCDREALEACLLTGDLGLVMIYVRDRNNILELSAQSASGMGDGSDLIERCAQYRVDLDVAFTHDRMVSEPDNGHPLFQFLDKWRLQLSVDLRWERSEGAEPWIGQLKGEAVPVATNLGSQRRTVSAFQNDHGVTTWEWEPWCSVSFASEPWQPWPVELTALDFDRFREQRPPPPLDPILTDRRPAPPDFVTFDFEGPLSTGSFNFARVLFHYLPGTRETSGSSCEPGRGSAVGNAVFGILVLTQPSDVGWTSDGGLLANEITLREPGSRPVIAVRGWPVERRTKTRSEGFPDPDVLDVIDWEGTITLTHTAPLN